MIQIIFSYFFSLIAYRACKSRSRSIFDPEFQRLKAFRTGDRFVFRLLLLEKKQYGALLSEFSNFFYYYKNRSLLQDAIHQKKAMG